MIEIMFSFGSEIVLVKIDGHSVTFGNTVYGAVMSTIEGLKLSKAGVFKEFPDLVDDNEWRVKAIERFKNKLQLLATEKEISDYIIEDLKKYGYKPMYKQKQGYRKEVIK
jgi:hypothetical protein